MNNSKKMMRIAMLGVSPADQVTFKGYLRVLLSLDIELEWVAATHSMVDLFVINDEFRQAASVIKLLKGHPRSTVLYLKRNQHGDGQLIENLLVLPLKQIQVLNDWLMANLTVINGDSTKYTGQNMASEQSKSPEVQQPKTSITPKKEVEPQSETMRVLDTSFNDVIDLITTLHKRSKSLYELIQGNDVLATIDPVKQRLWVKGATKPQPSSAWRLRLSSETSLDPKLSVDMNQWFWDTIWEDAGDLVRLVDGNNRYQILSWAKPDESTHRRELLKIMTAMMKQPVTIAQIVSASGVDMATARKAIAGLLVANHLYEANYRNIKVYGVTTASPTTKNPVVAPEPIPQPKPEPVVAKEEPAPEQKEKLGFLSRLRRKLGL